MLLALRHFVQGRRPVAPYAEPVTVAQAGVDGLAPDAGYFCDVGWAALTALDLDCRHTQAGERGQEL